MFEKLFKKKPNEKAVVKFWREFSDRADLYIDVLTKDEADSEDYYWVLGRIKDGLKRCCLDAPFTFEFFFDKESDPLRFTFRHFNEPYLKEAADLLAAHFPAELKNKILFLTAE